MTMKEISVVEDPSLLALLVFSGLDAFEFADAFEKLVSNIVTII